MTGEKKFGGALAQLKQAKDAAAATPQPRNPATPQPRQNAAEKYTTYLPTELVRALKQMGLDTNTRHKDLVTRAVREFLERQGRA